MNQINLNKGMYRKFSYNLLVALTIGLISFGCAEDSSPTDNNENNNNTEANVIRVMVENQSDQEVRYKPDITFYYPDESKESNMTGGMVGPNNTSPTEIDDSDEGAIGIKADITIDTTGGSLRIFIEEGYWEEDDGFNKFIGETVIEETGSGEGTTISLEYGDIEK